MSVAALDLVLGPSLNEEAARAIFEMGEEAVIFALPELARELAELKAGSAAISHQTPATPGSAFTSAPLAPASQFSFHDAISMQQPGEKRKMGLNGRIRLCGIFSGC